MAIAAFGGGCSSLLMPAVAHANLTNESFLSSENGAANRASAVAPSIEAPFVRQMPFELAQVNNADLACYLHTLDGQEYDLSALCSGYEEAAQEVVLQTGDVQVTLRWDTADDLDLYVRDPNGEEVSFFNPTVSSGGQLDVDANAACMERMGSPVENIFWPTGGGAPGDYVARVELFSHCGPENPINFTLNILVNGEVQTQTGTVSSAQSSMSFPFSFPQPGLASDAAASPASSLSPLPAPAQSL